MLILWRQKNLLSTCLLPLSWGYQLGRWVHQAWMLQTRYWAGVPVIAVGNLSVGGNGKTPLVLQMAQHCARDGVPVAILLRGYGGRQHRPYRVSDHDTPQDVGDEAVMLWQSVVGQSIHVWVGQDKVAVAKRAEQAGAALLIVDDGFQHVRLGRNVDIVVIEDSLRFGNGRCLPAGPLREPISALERASFAVVLNPQDARTYFHVLSYRLHSVLDAQTVQRLGTQPVVAFAGIGMPDKFFHALRHSGLNVVATQPWPDHHPYTPADCAQLCALAAQHQAQLVTTAKDATKLPPGFATVMPHRLHGEDWENIVAEIAERLR